MEERCRDGVGVGIGFLPRSSFLSQVSRVRGRGRRTRRDEGRGQSSPSQAEDWNVSRVRVRPTTGMSRSSF